MTTTHFTPAAARPSTRWLLLGSLALNLFFIGVAVAMAVRPPPPPPRNLERDIFVRTERLAEGLPKGDRDILVTQMNANRSAIELTQKQYRDAQEAIRESFRVEPFDANAMKAAMSKTRAARQDFDIAVQTAFANAAVQMSPAGRVALGDWRSRRGPNERNR